MSKFRVILSFTVSTVVEVEAEDPEAAIDAACDEVGGATTYAGNGSMCGLAGFRKTGIDLDTGEIEVTDWDEVISP